MADIKTVTLTGSEVKVEGLGGQNTLIVNRGSANLYVSAYADIVPYGDNVALVLPGSAMNLYDTNGTVYLLGTGKVQLQGTNTADLPIVLGGVSGGGGSAGVSQEYVDDADAATLLSAKGYTDDEITSVREDIPIIPDSLPADGGNAETAERLTWYSVRHDANALEGNDNWVKFFETNYTSTDNQTMLSIKVCDEQTSAINDKEAPNGILDITFRVVNGVVSNAKMEWEYIGSNIDVSNFVMGYYCDENNIYHMACFANLRGWYSKLATTILCGNNSLASLITNTEGIALIPSEYTTIIPSTVMPLFNTKELEDKLADLQAYVGYNNSDIYGLEVDFENNRFTRLAGAVGKTPGADFESINAFGGRRRCTVLQTGEVIAYYGDTGFDNDGWDGTNVTDCMVEQPKFYYKVVPLKTEKINGADGYHLRKARYYISDTPKPGFKVHPAFVQNGVEVDKIYLSAYEGSIRDISEHNFLFNDEQIADFSLDQLFSISETKPASGTTQELTIDNARKLAQNKGSGWGITTIQTLSATQLLFIIEYATFNSQAAIGDGICNVTDTSNNMCINTDSTSSLGNASGSVSSGGVSYRGEENLWGNMGMFVSDLNVSNPSDWNNSDSSTGIKNGTYTISNNIINIPSIYGNGYISSFGYDSDYDWVFLPTEVNGNTSIPIGDAYWNKNPGDHVPYIGGLNTQFAQVGIFNTGFNFNKVTHFSDLGARLIYIPQPAATQEVSE